MEKQRKKVIIVLILSLAVEIPTFVNGSSPSSLESIDLDRQMSLKYAHGLAGRRRGYRTESVTVYNQHDPLQGTVDFSNNREIQNQEIVPLELQLPLAFAAKFQLTVPMNGSKKAR